MSLRRNKLVPTYYILRSLFALLGCIDCCKAAQLPHLGSSQFVALLIVFSAFRFFLLAPSCILPMLLLYVLFHRKLEPSLFSSPTFMFWGCYAAGLPLPALVPSLFSTPIFMFRGCYAAGLSLPAL